MEGVKDEESEGKSNRQAGGLRKDTHVFLYMMLHCQVQMAFDCMILCVECILCVCVSVCVHCWTGSHGYWFGLIPSSINADN